LIIVAKLYKKKLRNLSFHGGYQLGEDKRDACLKHKMFKKKKESILISKFKFKFNLRF